MKIENLLILFLVAIALARLATYGVNTTFTWDEAVYLGLAEGLSEGKAYGYIGNQNVEAFRPPLFPVVLSGLYSIFGANIAVAQMFVVALFLASVFVFYRIAKNFLTRKSALLATLFLATNHLVIFFSGRIFVEMLALFLILLSFYFFIRMKKDLRFVLPLIATLALAVLARYNLFAIVIVYLVYAVIYERRLLANVLRSQYFILGLIVALLIVWPWADLVIKSPDTLANSPQFKFEKFGFPTNYVIYFWLLPLFATPFLILAAYRFYRAKEKFVIEKFSIVFIIVFVIITGLVLSSFRYLIPVVPFIGLLLASRLHKSSKQIQAVFIVLCFLNLATGSVVTYLFINPPDKFEQLPSFIEIRAYFSEASERKNSALFVAERTAENETVMTNAYGWLWLYTHRNWEPVPLTQEEFLQKTEALGIRYVYWEGGAPEYFSNPSIVNPLLDYKHIQVYEVV